MRVVDPGHEYDLDSLDGEQVNRLVFVKREGQLYPGNVGAHPGTTTQEVLRACVNRLEYVNEQMPCDETLQSIEHLMAAIYLLERRAARRHGRDAPSRYAAVSGSEKCDKCGHVGCQGSCRSHT